MAVTDGAFAVIVMVTRAEYLAGSFSRIQPWLAEGISRRQWERRRRKITAATSAPAASPRAVTSASAKAEGTPPRRNLTANVESPANMAPRAAVGPAEHISPPPAQIRTPLRHHESLILRLFHDYWDAEGMTPNDPEALAKAIHAIKFPEPFKHMDARALGKRYRRARARLPGGYDRWVDLVEKWDPSHDRRKARKLVDRFITAIGSNRPDKIAMQMFDHLERQFSGSGRKKIKRLERECDNLEQNECYIPQLRELKRDEDGEQVLAALADGPKTRRQLARMFQRSLSAISTIGTRLKETGQIKSIVRGGRFLWARRDYPAQDFVLARAAIVEALQKGPMNVLALVQETGKARSTIETALRRHLLPNHQVIRIKFGTYALPGTHPPYIFKRDVILPALETRPMTVAALAQATGSPLSTVYQALGPLLNQGKVICVKRGLYALRGTAPVYITTRGLIISALTRQPMKLGPLMQYINRRTNIGRSRDTVSRILFYLKRKGMIKQNQMGGEYRLARRAAAGEERHSTGRRKAG
jgi:DNA-binding transcriptional ArsR family regulator